MQTPTERMLIVRKRWTCEIIERVRYKISDSEMRQRLAEILELLLTSPSQLQRDPAFSSDKDFLKTNPRFNQKRKGRL